MKPREFAALLLLAAIWGASFLFMRIAAARTSRAVWQAPRATARFRRARSLSPIVKTGTPTRYGVHVSSRLARVGRSPSATWDRMRRDLFLSRQNNLELKDEASSVGRD